MIENLYSVPSTRTNSNPSLLARPLVSRILRSILLAIAVTLALTGLELGALALTNVFHWFGRGAVPVSQTVMDHILLLILIACAEFLIIAVVLFFIDRPLDILAYLRATQAALEAYCRAYTPLLSLNDVYETPVTGYLHNGGSTVEERQTTVRELVQWQGVDLFLLGGTGTGKTTALRAYQYRIVQSARSVVRRRQRIPIYIPLQEYSLFLEVHQQAHLLDFLRESDLEGLHRLRPYLKKLMDQGRLTLLCDGFNDVDPELQAMVANELVLLMLETRNLVIVACREEDYDRQPDFSMLVENGQAAMDVVAPLGLLEMRTFIEEYIEQSSQER